MPQRKRFLRRYKKSGKQRIIKRMDLREVIMGDKRPTAESEITSPRIVAPNQNLIRQSSVTIATRSPRTETYKAIALDVVAVLAAGLFGYAYYAYLAHGTSVWLLLAAFTFFGVLAALQVFLAKKIGQTLFVILLESLAVIVFFWKDNWQILAIIWPMVFVFLAWGYFSEELLRQ